MSVTRGLFISFEGIDGAGKSTHLDATLAWLRAQGRTVCSTREPGGTPLSETLREILLHQAMDPLTEALLMFAARREHVVQVIEPALSRGEVVVCDRFTDATFAYQGGGRGFDWAQLQQLEAMVQGLPAGGLRQPDLTLWFDLPAETAAQRRALVRAPDRFEAQDVAFFQSVRAGYARRQAESPARFARIDASASRELVADQVLATLQAFLGARA